MGSAEQALRSARACAGADGAVALNLRRGPGAYALLGRASTTTPTWACLPARTLTKPLIRETTTCCATGEARALPGRGNAAARAGAHGRAWSEGEERMAKLSVNLSRHLGVPSRHLGVPSRHCRTCQAGAVGRARRITQPVYQQPGQAILSKSRSNSSFIKARSNGVKALAVLSRQKQPRHADLSPRCWPRRRPRGLLPGRPQQSGPYPWYLRARRTSSSVASAGVRKPSSGCRGVCCRGRGLGSSLDCTKSSR